MEALMKIFHFKNEELEFIYFRLKAKNVKFIRTTIFTDFRNFAPVPHMFCTEKARELQNPVKMYYSGNSSRSNIYQPTSRIEEHFSLMFMKLNFCLSNIKP